MTASSIRTACLALALLLASLPLAAAEEQTPSPEAPAPASEEEAPADGEAGDSQTVPARQGDKQIQLKLPDPSKQLPLEYLRKFVEVFDRVKRGYVEEVSDQELLENAIEGMLSGLDPHSAYLEPEAYSDLEESTTGEFGGLGIEVGMEDGFVKVISPIDDTPAQKAGIQAGDLIVKIDDHPVKGMTLEEAVKLMRGKPGTDITLTIVREGESAPIDIVITRDVIKVTSIKSRLLEKGFGYIRISQFQAATGDDFKKAIKSLEKNTPLKGLILDLRNNPGGVLQAGVEVADALLDEGQIVYTKGRIKSSQLSFDASPGDLAHGVPIVVLINGGSASASEIVAGALQDHHRAVIMGTESFGKGSVQTIMPLDEKYAIKLTTARYYTPKGRSIQALGITPDIKVKAAKLTELDSQPFFTEADLSGHLTNDNGEASEAQEKEKTQKPAKEGEAESRPRDPLERDFQLRSALQLLKGLALFKQRNGEAPPAEETAAEETPAEEADSDATGS